MASKILEDTYNVGRDSVNLLLDKAEAIRYFFDNASDEASLHDQDQLINAIRSYNAAINSILSGHIPLHSEFIEHPRLMDIRKFLRANGGQ